MSGVYQFDDYIASAREALEEGSTDEAMEWVNQALSLSKHLEDEAIAQALHLKAQVLIAEEEYSEAEEALQRSLDMFRRNTEGHVLLGELMLLDGRHEAAASAFELAVEIAPENVHAGSLLIFCYDQLGKHDLAKKRFDKCIELGPDLADSYYHMGICFFREGNPEAKELFEKALSRNPVLSGPHYYLGRMKLAEGDLAAAEAELRTELELNPANSLAELELIRADFLGSPWKEGLELFDKHFPPEDFWDIPALSGCRFHFNYELLNEKFRSFIRAVKTEIPQTPENLFKMARVYRRKSLLGEAVELLKNLIETDKSFRPAYRELAKLYEIQDERGRGCEALEEAAAIFEDAEAYGDLGKAFLSCGRYDDAEEAARKAVSLGPDHAEPHYLLGAILAEKAARPAAPKGLTEEARASLLKALEIDPQSRAARAYLMHLAFGGEKYDECFELAERTLKENPEDRLALSYSGRCFHAVGDFALAEERLTKLLELYPDDQASRGALAEVYRAQRKFKEAVRELEQGIAIPARHPPADFLFRLGQIYLLDLNEPARAQEYLVRFLQAVPPGHPNFDRAKQLLGGRNT